LEALKNRQKSCFEINSCEKKFELWAFTDNIKTLIQNLSGTGKAFFEQHPKLVFLSSKKSKTCSKRTSRRAF